MPCLQTISDLWHSLASVAVVLRPGRTKIMAQGSGKKQNEENELEQEWVTAELYTRRHRR